MAVPATEQDGDVNECTDGTHNCHDEATCANTIGSFTCSCNDGYEGDGVSCDECPPAPPLPTVFAYEAARSAITNSTLDPAEQAEIAMEPFLNDLTAYAEYDGTPVADLPDTENIIIMPERWALTFTDPQTPGVTVAQFLDETRNFDPNVGLPDELPSVAIEAFRQRYPICYDRYLSNLEANYRNSRADVEFDIATYGPDADCPYPVRTDLGGGFALERIAPSLCRPVDRIEERDEETGRTIKVVISGEVVLQPLTPDGQPTPEEFWLDIDISQCDCSNEPPSNPPCTVVMCSSVAPFNNGDTCTYLCSGECSGTSTTVTCRNGTWDGRPADCQIRCPDTPVLPTDFDYEGATSAITDTELDPAEEAELAVVDFLNDLAAYAEYDGTPLADLPDTENIIIMPERWALTFTDPQTPGVTAALFLDETRDFDPEVGLPDELPSVAIEAFRQRYPICYDRYLSNLEANYRNSRADVEFDIATYGPDADCPYPVRTDLGGGFALERIAPSLCRPVDRIEERDEETGRTIKVVISGEVVLQPLTPDGQPAPEEFWLDMDISQCDCSNEPPSNPPCTVVMCNSVAPFNNGDTCTYLCSGECSGASTTVTCRNGTWDGRPADCQIRCPDTPVLPTDFDYEGATSAITDTELDPAEEAELAVVDFLNDLAAYAEYDGTPVADLPDTENIIIMPERWALTFTDPQTPGVTAALFLDETRDFDPEVGLPDELPSVAIEAFRQRYPICYDRYLSNLEANYRNLRADVEFDSATYGPDADCPYPVRTDLGGGFALERIAPSLCRPVDRIEERDEETGRTIKVVISGEIVLQPLTPDGQPTPEEFWLDIDISQCDCSTEPPSNPPCTVLMCNSVAPFNNGDTCTYLCSGECSGASTTVTCRNGTWDGRPADCQIRCPDTPVLPTDFDYEGATSAITDTELDPAEEAELAVVDFLNDLAAYAEYDGTPVADLPNTDNIIIMPERWALTFTDPQTPGVTAALFLDETRDFDPEVGLPDELPSVAIEAFRQRYPICYDRYLSNLEANYRNSRADVEFDSATYGPDADCPYPVRTELGGGFALERIAPSLCRPVDRIEERDEETGRTIKVVISGEIVLQPLTPDGQLTPEEFWLDIDISQCDCSTEPPSNPPCTVVMCNSVAPFNNGDTCTYLCSGECSGASTTVTCRNGTWDGRPADCQIRCPDTPVLPTDFDYEGATSAITDTELDPAEEAELAVVDFLNDLAAYAEYDGTPVADLPDTDNIIIMPERWALTFTDPQTPGVTAALFLDETRDFNPEVGLPAELPSVAIEAFRQRYPICYDRYLSNLEANYRNSRADVEFDIATYGPDADCPYPVRTELGGGFALERIAPSLCRPVDRIEERDEETGRTIKVVISGEIVLQPLTPDGQPTPEEFWLDIDISQCDCSTEPPSNPPCTVVMCNSVAPFNNGDTCTYLCSGECSGASTTVTCRNGTWDGRPADCQIRCPDTPVLPTDFDYEGATSAITDTELDPAEEAELAVVDFLNDLAAYAEYDGTPVADLPDTDNIIIMPERWALTFTDPQTPGVTAALFLDETRDFNPEVGLPDELPSVAIEAFRQRYPICYDRYLSNLEANYRNSRADVEFDIATYGPDADCPYPPRTDLGGGFALERIAPSLCRPVDRIEERDQETGRTIKVVISGEIVLQPLTPDGQPAPEEFWLDMDISQCDCSNEPPSNPPCTVVMCNSVAPFNNGDTCTYLCSGECSGASTTVTCRNGTWDGRPADCQIIRICDDGYVWSEVACVDIDECATGTDNCDSEATCTNTDGSFTCTCNDGYVGDGFICVDDLSGTCMAPPTPPTCIDVTCDPPDLYLYQGDTCTYSCAPGCYGASTTVTCLGHGNWDGQIADCQECPPWPPLPTDFDYEAATGAITGSTLDPAVAEEVGFDSFLTDLAAYAEYDGTSLADLPDTDNIIIMPERWVLTYTNEGVTSGLFLPETKNFDPEVGLPDGLPSFALDAIRQRYPLYYERYLSNLEENYRNSRTAMEFDSALYGPDADCPYPPRTDLGGGFALRRIAPTLCHLDAEVEATDPVTNKSMILLIGQDIAWEQFIEEEQDVRDEAWFDVDFCDWMLVPGSAPLPNVCHFHLDPAPPWNVRQEVELTENFPHALDACLGICPQPTRVSLPPARPVISTPLVPSVFTSAAVDVPDPAPPWNVMEEVGLATNFPYALDACLGICPQPTRVSLPPARPVISTPLVPSVFTSAAVDVPDPAPPWNVMEEVGLATNFPYALDACLGICPQPTRVSLPPARPVISTPLVPSVFTSAAVDVPDPAPPWNVMEEVGLATNFPYAVSEKN
ncbi:uncharacterized protein LOC144922177 [Branchiostoma floridae x Branchiostoma belcheri]